MSDVYFGQGNAASIPVEVASIPVEAARIPVEVGNSRLTSFPHYEAPCSNLEESYLLAADTLEVVDHEDQQAVVHYSTVEEGYS